MRSAVAVLLALMFIPAATAGSVPTIGFLVDDGTPVAPGAMSYSWPTGNESSQRIVPPQIVGKALFVDVEERPGESWQGRILMGVWPTQAVAKESQMVAKIWVDGVAVANASMLVDIDPEQVPEPTSFIPPDPSDPEGAVMHAAIQAVPLIIKPPVLLDFGIVDIDVPADAEVSVSLYLDGPDLPTTAAMGVQYDSLLTPSFLYLPWYAADPEAEAPQAQPVAQPAPTSSSPPHSEPQENEPVGEDSPLPIALLLVALVVAARRR